MHHAFHCMLFPLDVGLSIFCFVNISTETMRFAQNWKSGFHTREHTDTVIIVKHCPSVSDTPLRPLMTFTCLFHHKLKRPRTWKWVKTLSCWPESSWIPSLETAKQKKEVANLTSLSVSPYLRLSLFSNFCLLTSASPNVVFFLHALPLSSLPLAVPISRARATHPPLFSLIPAAVTQLLPRLFFIFSSGDGDWQMIWQRKTSGEEKS